MKIILYTIGCPKCDILEKLLKEKSVKFETITDTQIMIDKGFIQTPMLEVDGEIMNYPKAYTWIKNIIGGKYEE